MNQAAKFGEFEFSARPSGPGFGGTLDQLLLLREMHHRFANTLTSLSALLRCHLRRKAADCDDRLEWLQAHISAVGALHRFLLVRSSDDWFSVPCYFEHLCRALSGAVLEPLGIRCEADIDAGEMAAERCELLGLVIVELVTNAAKHAFRGRDGGLVRIALARNADVWLCTVTDNGAGMRAGAPGLGSNIIKQLVHALGGFLVTNSAPGKTTVAITCPVEERGVCSADSRAFRPQTPEGVA